MSKNISRQQKGSYYEMLIRNAYKRYGYVVDYKKRSALNIGGRLVLTKGNKDIFALWDIIAISKDKLEFIQVKTNSVDVSKFKKKAESFMLQYGHRACFTIILCEGEGNYKAYFWNAVRKMWERFIPVVKDKVNTKPTIKMIINPHLYCL